MNSKKNQLEWILVGSIPAVLLPTAYVAIDIATSSTWRDLKIIILILSLLSLIISGVAAWHAKGWYKLFPIFSILINLMLILWLYFALNFTVAF